MPAVSRKQQMFMGAELRRKRAGEKTKTKMSEQQLKEFAGNPHPHKKLYRRKKK